MKVRCRIQKVQSVPGLLASIVVYSIHPNTLLALLQMEFGKICKALQSRLFIERVLAGVSDLQFATKMNVHGCHRKLKTNSLTFP